MNSLIDYLDPAATGKFLEFTHEQYKKYIGDEFGKTVLGFRGDEPEYNFMPWSPKLLEIFKTKKGYDIAPYLASFLTVDPNDEQKLAKADLWDVWSDLFRDNFFKVEADWCEANGLEYIVHIDHEERLMELVRTEGDYFKDMRYVQIPGVDAIWHQIWYDNADNYPKIASSAAHMYGRARSFSESFAAYSPVPTVTDVRWVINEEMVRGINLFEYMHWGSPYIKDPAFLPVSLYSNRATWLLANGIPTASVGVYCPTESMWVGNRMSDSVLKVISRKLLGNQVDFDYIDRQGIDLFKLEKGAFINLSGQRYTTLIIPTVSVMNEDVLVKLKAFAAEGGKVIFIGDLPGRIADPNFVDAGPAPTFSWAEKVDWQRLDTDFFAHLPHDVRLNQAAPDVKYLHRRWKDADLYFFFNEGKQRQDLTIIVDGIGQPKIWDANTGKVHGASGTVKKGSQTTLPLALNGYDAVFLIIKN
jgi:alpha-L-rhamnosidase